ncbi:hypothetical protein [Castellaniella sp.]|uniref:hypothetical protein n=1 Tax=Castellaniella sp. TaxID=1955812 RepID=UPI002AFDF45A|nr:hypothetical protein [Castellaniella sp.]
MKKNHTTAPFIQITRAGEKVAVMFSCGAAARVVFVPQDKLQQLSWEMSDPSIEGDAPAPAKLFLLVTRDDAPQVKRYEMGDVRMAAGVARQAIAEAFGVALISYLQDERMNAVEVPPALVSRPGVFEGHKPKNSAWWKMPAFLVLAALISFAAVAGLESWSGGKMDPIQAAVSQNMTQDPASIMAQVELTKETLRQMGLDPGRGGDLGCLAPQ